MRFILVVTALTFGTLALADEASDRKEIDAVVSQLNERNRSHTDLFTNDSGDSQERLEAMLAQEVRSEVWSETSPPFFAVRVVRFITSRVALVDAARTRYGSTFTRSAPLVLVLRKDGADWRIAAVRVVAGNLISTGGVL